MQAARYESIGNPGRVLLVAERSGSGKVLWKGEVLKSEPPHLLAYYLRNAKHASDTSEL